MNDTERGLYRKYKVERMDGQSRPGRKHAGCGYFVLDVWHDPFAMPALKAYADACEATYPELAQDLRFLTRPLPRREQEDEGHG